MKVEQKHIDLILSDDILCKKLFNKTKINDNIMTRMINELKINMKEMVTHYFSRNDSNVFN